MTDYEQASLQKTLATLVARQDLIRQDLADIKKALKEGYVTKEEFWPIRTLVYGFTGIILLAVIGALVAMVVTGGSLP